MIGKYLQEITKMIDDNIEDEKIYDRLREILKNNTSNFEVRAERKYNELMKMLPDFENDKTFACLDVGCMDGTLLGVLAKTRKLNKDQVYGIDIEVPKRTSVEKLSEQFNYYLYEGSKLPDEMVKLLNERKQKLNVVTAFAVLHHIDPKYLDSLLKSIYANMEYGGYFIIREHDCRNKKLVPVIDVEHVIYSTMGIEPERTYEKFMQENPRHTGYYKSEEEWNVILSNIGLKRVQLFTSKSDIPSNFRTAMYLASYIKPPK